MKIFLPFTHRNTIYPILLLTLCLVSFSGCLTAPTSNSVETMARIVPDTLDKQTVYPTNHVVVPLDPLTQYQWQEINLPQAWTRQGYYFEIWDGDNRPIPGYRAQTLQQPSINLNDIDASLYPKIRIIFFQPKDVPDLTYNQPIFFSYTTAPNYRLLLFFTMMTILYSGLAMAALHFRLTLKTVLVETKNLLRNQVPIVSLKQIITFAWLTIIWSGFFGIVLGTYVGGIQIAYLLIKLPFLFLGALITSGLSLVVLALLLGINASVKEIVTRTVELLATTALSLAAFTPLILFYIYLPQTHDELLVSTVLFIALSGGLAAYRLFVWLGSKGVKMRIVYITSWLLLYGMVFMQLGWQLRPWVGTLDPVHNSVPFARSQSGNVFVELKDTLERSTK